MGRATPPDVDRVSGASGAGDDASGPGRRVTAGRVVTTVVVLGLVLMWIYAFSGLAKKDPPDLLDDPAFATAAGPVCAEAVEQLDALPSALRAATPEARAATLAEANAVLAAMVAELRALAPAGDPGEVRDARIVGLWLDDWETHLSDRAAYVDVLEEGSEAPPVFTARGGRSITATIDHFATVNDIERCATPLDV